MDKKIYRVFIASPSDTNKERESIETVFDELNIGIGEIYNFRLESIKWEKDVRPTIKNTDGQSIIFEQTGDEYEIFVGIMSRKFGSPTPRMDSGTEEEFHRAFNRYQEKKDVEVFFYFNDSPPASMSEIKAEELLKIENFKKKIQGLGIYGTYNGSDDFSEKIRKHLTKFFIEQYKLKSQARENLDNLINKEAIRKIYTKRLNDSLKGFDGQPLIWVEPVISRTSELSQNPDENYSQRAHIEELIHSDKSYIINAPTQFGLTSLGHYLVKEAWEHDKFWIFLDNNTTKSHNIQNAVINESNSLDQKNNIPECIVYDSFYKGDKNSFKKLKILIESNPNSRIIILNTVDESIYLKNEEQNENEEIKIEKQFVHLHLIALPRNQIRKIVSEYNLNKRIGEDEKVLNKVTTELECLNLHRTPYNIFTILKVSEKYFDDSPINRTKMIEMILFVLFDLGEIPRYKIKPDLKDCEYVLGKFCESMIKSGIYSFQKDSFISELSKFCSEKYLQLDVNVVFEVLYLNNIIASDGLNYKFKSSFWILYFGAKRMHNDENFRKYIFDTKKYTSFPEIIEFYTGIDRNRNDALKQLLSDISTTKSNVEQKLGINGEINPLRNANWRPSEENISKIQSEIGENVLTSKLPTAVKDQFVDKSYNQVRPYNQSIQRIFEEYSLVNLMQQIKASSVALRNSDYAEPEIKRKLLSEIYLSWNQLAKVLFALSPIMASKGKASFEGAAFELDGNFGDTFEEKLNIILQVLPTNIVGYFKEELYSPKIGPLLFDAFNSETNDLIKHHQALLIIFKRPIGWKKEIENYVTTLNKNSFYLYDIVKTLRARYRYDFLEENEVQEIKYLVKMGLAKHKFGDKKPGLHQIVKIADSNLPKRENKLE